PGASLSSYTTLFRSEFAARFDLPVIRTVRPPADFEGGAWTGEGEKINSANAELDLNGLGEQEAKERATAYAQEKGFGRARTTFRDRKSTRLNSSHVS